MAALRRSLFSIIAAFAMLCGISWTAAAYACPVPVAAQPADDGCRHSKPVSSTMPYCGPVCLGVVPTVAAVAPIVPMHPPTYHAAVETFHDHLYAPDPPPPRAA